MTSDRPGLSLEEARARLRRLGYLQGGVERFVFARALGSVAGRTGPVLLTGAFAGALAETGAVAACEFRYAEAPWALGGLFLHLFLVALFPSAAFTAFLLGAAARSQRPGRGGAGWGLAAAGGTLSLWVLATWSLGADRPSLAFAWGIPIALAAVLFGSTARTTFLARAFARSGRLPERPRRAILLAAAAAAFSLSAVLFALRRDPVPAAPPLPSPRRESVVVLAVDGLALDGDASGGGPVARLLGPGATGWWAAGKGSPAEIWTDLATGVPASRHGVRALEWVRPWKLPALRPPFGTAWYFRKVGMAAGAVSRAPVSAWERRTPAFWEVAASAGLPSLAVGWWASGAWPGATVVENREIFARAASGPEADAAAIERFEKLAPGRAVATVYLPGPDIVRAQPAARGAALARVAAFLAPRIGAARRGEVVLIVIAADSHPGRGSLGRMVVFDGANPHRLTRIRPEDLAPSILARAGVPTARDVPGRPAAFLFAPGSLETATVATYGERVAPGAPDRRESDREYLEKLRSLGYLN